MGAQVVLGLDFGGSKIAACVADLFGRRLGTATVLTDPALGAGWNLGLGIATARSLLDDVAGGMARSWPRLEAPLRRALDANVPYPPELVLGVYPFDAALVGAVALGVEAAAAAIADGSATATSTAGPTATE